MAGLVDIVLPSGEAATVPEADLPQALAAGATQPKGPAGPDGGGLLGELATGVIGAGSTATFGASDAILSDLATIYGGRQSREQVTGELRQAREANPKALLAGEAAGLLLNPNLTAAGESAEAAVANRLGDGLLGRVASMGARGGLEGAMLGAQHQITEDSLGDHGYNAEAIWASGAKDALLGAGMGAALGAASHYLGKPAGLMSRPGRASDAVLDEIAEVPGAGRKLAEDARVAEKTVEGLRKTGLTSEEAAKVVDEINDVAKVATSEGRGAAVIDDIAERFAEARSGGNPERKAMLMKAFNSSGGKLADAEATIERHALDMADKGTRVLRNLEDTVNEVQFTQKSEQFAKLVDSSRASLQRDQVAKLLQDTDDVLKFWEGTASKGGAEGAVRTLRRQWNDTLDTLAKVEDAATPTMSRDLFIRTEKLKRGIDRTLQWGRENRFGLPEAITHSEMGLEPLSNKLRSALEDANVWGEAGVAQSRWNASFSGVKARRDHFMQQLGVSIDQQAGLRIPEVDFAKTKSMLGSLQGAESDAALQSVKSTEAAISGFRDRAAAIKEFGELTKGQAAKLEAGLKDLDAFEASFKAARKEAAEVNRLKAAVLEERDAQNIGGLLGLAGSVVTQPLTTMQRLARVRQTTQRVEDAIVKGLERFFGSEPGAAGAVAEGAAKRSKDTIIRELEDIRSTRGNIPAQQERAKRLTGDMAKFAPKIADELQLTAVRALDYLAREAPPPAVRMGILGVQTATDAKGKAKPVGNYSDQAIHDWETKRRAALDPQSVVKDLQSGKLNRDAIKAVEFVSPKLFAKMQELAIDQITKLEQQGKLDKMPYQQKAVIATLLKVPADQTWTPDFMVMMQAAKVTPVAEAAPQGPQQPNSGVTKREVKINSSVYATEADTIEQGRAA